MIDLNYLNVRRLIIHTINPKQEGQDCASVEASNEISLIDNSVLEIIKVRLIDAAGRNSKAFELEIENVNRNSFFDLINEINRLDDPEFIKQTLDIAYLLADAQRKISIPGGYLLIMDCFDSDTLLPIYIVIKAEPHEALQFSETDGHTQVNVLNKVFLSPSQKLYKIGIVYKLINEELENINEQFGCFLYDDQFRTETHPAEYFYKDFLGFSVGSNSKIQSQRFYEKTTTFILNNFIDFESKSNLISVLKNEFSVNQNPTVNPLNFANEFIPTENGLRDMYISDVCQELPFSIVKDNCLIKNKIQKRKIDFPKNINLSGPEESFDNNVEIISTNEMLYNMTVINEEYTILKILGKPYSANE